MVTALVHLLLAAALAAPTTDTPGPSPEPPTPPRVREVSLSDALAELERQNLTLAQVRSRTEEASALVRQSASAILPALTAQAGYTRNSAEAKIALGSLLDRLGIPRTSGPSTVFIQPLESFSAQGTVRLPLLVPSAWFDLAAARDAARGAGHGAAAARQQVRAGLVEAAHGSVALEESVVASERAVDSAAELARSAERRVAAGTAAPLDLLRARTELVRRQSDLENARAQLDRSRLALGILLARAYPIRIAVPAPPSADDLPQGEEALAAEALSRRPEIRAQAASIDAAEAQIRSAWARLAPQLSASGSVFASDVPYPTGERTGWRATVDLAWTLYDGGFRYGKRRQAEAAAAGARAAAEAERLAVVQEALDAARDLAVAKERFRLAESQRSLASDAAASAKRSFDAGIASSLDVIDSNDRLYLADVGLADARARLASARVATARALGRDL